MTTHVSSLASEHCVANAKALGESDIATLSKAAPGWTRKGGAIERRFKFKDFHHTMAFVNAVAWIAHREDHHPDLAVGYDHCGVTWSTHSAGGLTRNDYICAARTGALVDA